MVEIPKLYNGIEQLFVKISHNQHKILLGTTYIPPASSLDAYLTIADNYEQLKTKYKEHSLILTGDFNLPKISWNNNPEVTTHHSMEGATLPARTAAEVLAMVIASLNLEQYYPSHQLKGYTLDLLFAEKHTIKYEHSTDSIVPPDKDHHEPATFSLGNLFLQHKQAEQRKFNYNRMDTESCIHCLNQLNWSDSLSINKNDMEMSTELFYRLINEAIDLTTPKSGHCNNTYPSWYTEELITKLQEKKQLHKTWKSDKDEKTYIKFKLARAQCIKMSRTLKRENINYMQSLAQLNLKSFWNYVNSKRTSRDIPGTMSYGSRTAENGTDIANLFAEYYSTVHEKPAQVQVTTNLTSDTQQHLSDIITTQEVIEAIKELTPYTTSGPDNIPPIFFKKCAKALIEPIHLLTNLSLSTGIVPEIWKNSYINPKKKEETFTDVTSSRPLSKINALASIMESIIYKKIEAITRTKITHNQHGFVKGRSILTNLLQLSNNILEAFKSDTQIVAVYLDFLKAFDKVDHNILLNKLQKMGITGNTLKWLQSYLHNRFQTVIVNGHKSKPYRVTSGIPQGSRLGPLLFIIFINDIFDCIDDKTTMLGYADDCKLLRTVNNEQQAAALQNELKAISNWATENKLPLNAKKCKYIVFSKNSSTHNHHYYMDNECLERVNKMRDLGVIVDEGWTFDEHINNVVAKASKTLGFIKRTTEEFNNLNTIVYLFKSLVLPQLNYASIIWTPHTQQKYNKIDAVIRKFLRYAAFKNKTPMSFDNHNYSEISLKCNISTTASAHHYLDLAFVNDVLNGKIQAQQLICQYQPRNNTYTLRNARPLKESTNSSNTTFYSPLIRTTRNWNKYITDTTNNNQNNSENNIETNNIMKQDLKTYSLRNF